AVTVRRLGQLAEPRSCVEHGALRRRPVRLRPDPAARRADTGVDLVMADGAAGRPERPLRRAASRRSLAYAPLRHAAPGGLPHERGRMVAELAERAGERCRGGMPPQRSAVRPAADGLRELGASVGRGAARHLAALPAALSGARETFAM